MIENEEVIYFEIGALYKTAENCILYRSPSVSIDTRRELIPRGCLVLCIDFIDNHYKFLYNNEIYFKWHNHHMLQIQAQRLSGFVISKKTQKPKKYIY